MKRNFYLLILLISFAGYGQTFNRNAKDFFFRGNDKFSGKDYQGAIEDFTRAIEIDPGFKQAYENRGVAKFRLDDQTGAIADYSRALEIDPQDYSTYGRRGVARFNIQDYRGTIDDITKALEGPKINTWYYNIRGRARYHMGDFNGAITDFNKVIMTFGSGKTWKSNAYYWRGLSEIGLGQNENGCLDLKKASKSGYKMAKNAIERYCNK
jgi:tetratricopeptide (TPR) repeat protein